ncbi:biotin transporter BioY [Candidatus Dependentiae bacterium]|nr:biotin transporter BioY [Candidatus Dependentiae bacterium]
MISCVKNLITICDTAAIKQWFDQASISHRTAGYFALSWIFALGAQVVIPLPFTLVPLVLNPFPLLVAAHLLGIHAVYAYGLYLMQGASGIPVFLGLRAGVSYLFGPTGGYTFGFGLAMLLCLMRSVNSHSRPLLLAKLFCCAIIYFGCGLAQLWIFVPTAHVLKAGLYPFIIGDACKLLALVILFGRNDRNSCQ